MTLEIKHLCITFLLVISCLLSWVELTHSVNDKVKNQRAKLHSRGGWVSCEMTLRHVRWRALNIYYLEPTTASWPEKHTRLVFYSLLILEHTLFPLAKIVTSLNDCLISPGFEFMVPLAKRCSVYVRLTNNCWQK